MLLHHRKVEKPLSRTIKSQVPSVLVHKGRVIKKQWSWVWSTWEGFLEKVAISKMGSQSWWEETPPVHSFRGMVQGDDLCLKWRRDSPVGSGSRIEVEGQ